MTAILEAMTRAGVPMPTVKERLWRAIKEAPGTTGNQLIKQLPGIPKGSIRSQLSTLEAKGCIYSKGTKGPGKNGSVKAYYTDLGTYVFPSPEAKPRAAPPTPPSTFAFDLDALTIREARALYHQLRKMFQ